jgi:hypothetical protein
VGVELDAPFAGHGEVVGSSTPAGSVVTTTHFGPYQRLHEAHHAICDWCARRGYSLAGPNWEIYGHWVDEWNTSPDKIRTDVFYLLRASPVSSFPPLGGGIEGGSSLVTRRYREKPPPTPPRKGGEYGEVIQEP